VLGVIRSGFPDVRASIEVILAEGDLVASRTTAEGTHTREYFGVAPTGKRVTLRQISIDRIRVVMYHFRGEQGQRKSIAPSRKLWTAPST